MGLPLVMGVVNVTPDSFSDGGLYADAASAIAHGGALLADGADILDVGGESTRPGATRPLVEEELDRVIPVITALAEGGATVSVDTMRHQVAAAALGAGATIVNDVSGGLADPEILRVVADADATYVAMHWRAHADHMTDFATYDNPGGVVVAVRDELAQRVEAALAAGVAPERLVLDPGLGFAKRGRHNWQLLADLAADPGAGPPAAGRRQPQVVPRHPAGGRRGEPTPGGRPRRRHHRPLRAARTGGGVGAPGARRTLHPRRPASAGRTRHRSGGGRQRWMSSP